MSLKNIYLILSLVICFSAYSREVFYTAPEDRDLGEIIFSLGYRRLDARSAVQNSFKYKKTVFKRKLKKGETIRFDSMAILFTKNAVVRDGKLVFKKIVRQGKQWKDQTKNHPPQRYPMVPEKLYVDYSNGSRILIKSSPWKQDYYLGIGGFAGQYNLSDSSAANKKTSTFQPLLFGKAIVSHLTTGTLGVEGTLKKAAVGSSVNYDLRTQFIPIFLRFPLFNIGLNFSKLNQSYAGESKGKSVVHKFDGSFVGVSLLFPQNVGWLELILEKGLSANVKAPERKLSVDAYRLGTLWTHQFRTHWYVMPAISYVSGSYDTMGYKLNFVEAKLSIAREFNF